MIELVIEANDKKLDLVYFPEEYNYPDATEKLKGMNCRIPTIEELRTIFDFVLKNPDSGIPLNGSIWSSEPVVVRGRNDQFVMTKSFYDGKHGGDVGMEGMQPHVNLSVKLFLIGIKTN